MSQLPLQPQEVSKGTNHHISLWIQITNSLPLNNTTQQTKESVFSCGIQYCLNLSRCLGSQNSSKIKGGKIRALIKLSNPGAFFQGGGSFGLVTLPQSILVNF